ncbi:hypothetical protein C8R43DRAFT_1229289 [Mycena crocata]|nr:hypothetical protein C8R43DRAFT_1229289 [Mycena crocata]
MRRRRTAADRCNPRPRLAPLGFATMIRPSCFDELSLDVLSSDQKLSTSEPQCHRLHVSPLIFEDRRKPDMGRPKFADARRCFLLLDHHPKHLILRPAATKFHMPLRYTFLIFGVPLQLQPPPAPRLRNIPLPDPRVAHLPHNLPATQNVFPIDLTRRVDFDLLGRSVENYSIPAHTTVYIVPTSHEFTLLEINTGDTPATAFSIIRRLQTEMRALLSLRVYRVGLPPVAQQLVRDYFLSHSGTNGARLWQAFLNGARYPRGPRGADLLRGHSCMWGFGEDFNGRWVIDVDLPFQM